MCQQMARRSQEDNCLIDQFNILPQPHSLQLANVVADLLYGYKKHNENPSPDEFLRLLELSSMPCPELQSGNGS